LEIVLIVCFLLLTAFYSGVETAYTVFDRILLEVWMRSKRRTARLVKFFSDHPERFLGTTLIGTNLSNVAYSTIFAIFAAERGLAPVWIIVTAPAVVLILGVVLPKAVFYGSANLVVRVAALPLWFSFVFFAPIYLFVRLTNRVLAGGRERTESRKSRRRFYPAEELQLLLTEAHHLGMVSHEEGKLLSHFFVLRDRKVREVMTPRTRIVALSESDNVAQARRRFIESGHTKLPVYHGDLDHIIGHVSARDFLVPVDDLSEVLRPISVVPETKRVRELLKEFRQNRGHIAVVVDEHGGTDGVVTLEDVLEELLGPVEDEFDKGEPICRRIGANSFLVAGRTPLDMVASVTGAKFPTGDYSTLSGYILTELGRIPDTGEELMRGGWRHRILMADARRVVAVLMAQVNQG
jgi:putative hemolysin